MSKNAQSNHFIKSKHNAMGITTEATRLDNLLTHPLSTFQFLERYVNDGSPSGFTEHYRTSPQTDPWSDVPHFNLHFLEDSSDSFDTFGESTANPYWQNYLFLLHPNMADHIDLSGYQIHCSALPVVPTSSARTVQILDEHHPDFVKLYYDGIVGRNNRRLYRTKAIAGPEISRIVLDGIQAHVLHEGLSILHEPMARVHRNRNIRDQRDHWGVVLREYKPRGTRAFDIKYLVPLFSLWSRNRKDKSEPTLLEQFADVWQHDAEEIILHQILETIIDIHFQLITRLGLQFEFNAQNVLLGFDENHSPVSIVLRDMMDAEKDLRIRRSLGLTCSFASSPYHVLYEDDVDFAKKRHSFAFDFKLSKYVVEPLVHHANENEPMLARAQIESLKQRVAYWQKALPEDYFPDSNTWYAYGPVLIDKEKHHVKMSAPLLR